jgi:hypothetical protein
MPKHGLPLEPRKNWSALERGPTREDIWDRFVDELDRSGQAGSAADVITPTTLDPNAPSGKRFADLTLVEVKNLATIAVSLGRRGDVVTSMWQHTQRQLKPRPRKRRV